MEFIRLNVYQTDQKRLRKICAEKGVETKVWDHLFPQYIRTSVSFGVRNDSTIQNNVLSFLAL